MKKIILFAVIVIALVGGVYGIAKYKNSSDQEKNNDVVQQATSTVPDSEKIQSDIVLFYGVTCPHCKVVEDFLKENKVADKLKFENLEVYNNKQNAQLMQEKQDQCKDLSEDDKGGVPFLYSSEKCLVGSDTIINHFKQKLNIS